MCHSYCLCRESRVEFLLSVASIHRSNIHAARPAPGAPPAPPAPPGPAATPLSGLGPRSPAHLRAPSVPAPVASAARAQAHPTPCLMSHAMSQRCTMRLAVLTPNLSIAGPRSHSHLFFRPRTFRPRTEACTRIAALTASSAAAASASRAACSSAVRRSFRSAKRRARLSTEACPLPPAPIPKHSLG